MTTVFEGVDSGPGTYAKYLWGALRDDPEVEFHLVAPEASERHTRLHSAGRGAGSLGLYRTVQEAGMKLAAELGPATIIHGNSTHSMGEFVGCNGPLIVQVNDYDTAMALRRMWGILRERGWRRLTSLVWRHWQERRVLRQATLALCNSSYTANAIRDAYGLPEKRTKVLYKAVDTSAFKRPACLPKDPMLKVATGHRLLFVGTDWRRKGLDVLLHAVHQLEAAMPGLLVTAIGPYENDAQLGKLIRDLDLGARVILTGRLPVEAVARHLWYSDLFVLPSRREALGVAVLEAMAAEVPVIATRVGGIPEIVRNDNEGVLVAPDDVTSLVAAVADLLGDPARRRALGVEGALRAKQFSVPSMVQEIRNLYLEIAALTDTEHCQAGLRVR